MTNDEIERLRIGHRRWEQARRMDSLAWANAWHLAIREGKTIDEIIDSLCAGNYRSTITEPVVTPQTMPEDTLWVFKCRK